MLTAVMNAGKSAFYRKEQAGYPQLDKRALPLLELCPDVVISHLLWYNTLAVYNDDTLFGPTEGS